MFKRHGKFAKRATHISIWVATTLITHLLISTEDIVASQRDSVSTPRVVSHEKFPFALNLRYRPTGWMGDGIEGRKYISFDETSAVVDGQTKIVDRITYRRGPAGWAGIYWQHPDNNWGRKPGLNLTGAHKITFMARGNTGGEVVEFKAGGTDGPHGDTFETSLGKQALTTKWRAYEIDLSGLDLSNVVGAFAWSAPAPTNGELVFYITDLYIR